MVTADTNVAVYALARGEKAERAEAILASADFLSAQVLNEYSNVAHRKLHRRWSEVTRDIELLQQWVAVVRPVEAHHAHTAVRLADRYQLPFYHSLLLAVALSSGARTFYSEDMKNGMVIDGTLTIIDPFLTTQIT